MSKGRGKKESSYRRAHRLEPSSTMSLPSYIPRCSLPRTDWSPERLTTDGTFYLVHVTWCHLSGTDMMTLDQGSQGLGINEQNAEDPYPIFDREDQIPPTMDRCKICWPDPAN